MKRLFLHRLKAGPKQLWPKLRGIIFIVINSKRNQFENYIYTKYMSGNVKISYCVLFSGGFKISIALLIAENQQSKYRPSHGLEDIWNCRR